MSGECKKCHEHALDCRCKLSDEGQFFTIDQLISFLESQKCCQCDKKARWIPFEKGIAYCDDHYPYTNLK